MEEKTYTGSELADALKKGDLVNTEYMVSGIVRESATEGYIALSISNGRQWIDIPTQIIKTAEQVFIDLPEIDDPIARITFNEPRDNETKALLELLRAAFDNLSEHLSAVDDLAGHSNANSIIARAPIGPSPTGAWCCKRGKAYICGTDKNGNNIICCREYEPCTTIGPSRGGFIG